MGLLPAHAIVCWRRPTPMHTSRHDTTRHDTTCARAIGRSGYFERGTTTCRAGVQGRHIRPVGRYGLCIATRAQVELGVKRNGSYRCQYRKLQRPDWPNRLSRLCKTESSLRRPLTPYLVRANYTSWRDQCCQLWSRERFHQIVPCRGITGKPPQTHITAVVSDVVFVESRMRGLAHEHHTLPAS